MAWYLHSTRTTLPFYLYSTLSITSSLVWVFRKVSFVTQCPQFTSCIMVAQPRVSTPLMLCPCLDTYMSYTHLPSILTTRLAIISH